MKRVTGALLGLYLLSALVGRVAERIGVTRCACLDDCWCKRPGLSTFRWVFPWGHSLPPSDD